MSKIFYLILLKWQLRECVVMPTFLVIARHSPENCALFNEKARKASLAYMKKLDTWSKKYGVKVVGSADVPSEHLHVMICEAANLEAFEKLGTEPEVMAMGAYSTIEIKTALNMEEIMKMLQQIR
jgi:hypothetical protein